MQSILVHVAHCHTGSAYEEIYHAVHNIIIMGGNFHGVQIFVDFVDLPMKITEF